MTTFTLQSLFHGVSSFFTHPTSFYQLHFQGPEFVAADGTKGQMFWFNVLSFYTTGFGITDTMFTNLKLRVDVDIAPTHDIPGSFVVEFQEEGSTSGIFHFGIWRGTWTTILNAGHHFIILLESEIDLDQSTVAILN